MLHGVVKRKNNATQCTGSKKNLSLDGSREGLLNLVLVPSVGVPVLMTRILVAKVSSVLMIPRLIPCASFSPIWPRPQVLLRLLLKLRRPPKKSCPLARLKQSPRAQKQLQPPPKQSQLLPLNLLVLMAVVLRTLPNASRAVARRKPSVESVPGVFIGTPAENKRVVLLAGRLAAKRILAAKGSCASP